MPMVRDAVPALRKLVHGAPLLIFALVSANLPLDPTTTTLFTMFVITSFNSSIAALTFDLSPVIFEPINAATVLCFELAGVLFLDLSLALRVSAVLDSPRYGWILYASCALPTLPLLNDAVALVKGREVSVSVPPPVRELMRNAPLSIFTSTVLLLISFTNPNPDPTSTPAPAPTHTYLLATIFVTSAFCSSLSTITFHPTHVAASRRFECLSVLSLAIALASLSWGVLDNSRFVGFLLCAFCMAPLLPFLNQLWQWVGLGRSAGAGAGVEQLLSRATAGLVREMVQDAPLVILSTTVALFPSAAATPRFAIWIFVAFTASLSAVTFHPRYPVAAGGFEQVGVFSIGMAFASLVSPLLGWPVYAACTVPILPLLEEDLSTGLQTLHGWMPDVVPGSTVGGEPPNPPPATT